MIKKTVHELTDSDGISLFCLVTEKKNAESIQNIADYFENESYYVAENFEPEYFISGLHEYFERKYSHREYAKLKEQGNQLWFKLDEVLEDMYKYYLRHVQVQDVDLDKDTFPALFVDATSSTYKLECKITGYIMSPEDVLFHMEDKMFFDNLISSSKVQFTKDNMKEQDAGYYLVEDDLGELTKEIKTKAEELIKTIKLKDSF